MVEERTDMPVVGALSHIAGPLVVVALVEPVAAGAGRVVCPVAAAVAAPFALADGVIAVDQAA